MHLRLKQQQIFFPNWDGLKLELSKTKRNKKLEKQQIYNTTE